MTATGTHDVARAYVEAVGAHDLDVLDDLFDDDLVAVFAGVSSDKATWIAALHRLLPGLLRNDIRQVFVAGDGAAVDYDFVTDTAGGTIRCIELVTVHDDRITAIELILDRVAFGPVNQELAARAAG